MSGGGDNWRWALEAPERTARSIAVIEPTPEDAAARRDRERKRVVQQKAERVPFGFARALIERGLCGHPHPRTPSRLGGCTLPYGHAQASHRYDPATPGQIRP